MAQAIGSDNLTFLYRPGIQIQFSQELQASTVTSATVRILDSSGNPVYVLVDYELGNLIMIGPREKLTPGMTYTIVVSTGVTDRAGNSLAREYRSSFQVAYVAPPPITIPLATKRG